MTIILLLWRSLGDLFNGIVIPMFPFLTQISEPKVYLFLYKVGKICKSSELRTKRLFTAYSKEEQYQLSLACYFQILRTLLTFR